jgi:hypothetical protein
MAKISPRSIRPGYARTLALADAYSEAWDRGKAWQEGIISGLAMMPDNGKAALATAIGVSMDELGKRVTS